MAAIAWAPYHMAWQKSLEPSLSCSNQACRRGWLGEGRGCCAAHQPTLQIVISQSWISPGHQIIDYFCHTFWVFPPGSRCHKWQNPFILLAEFPKTAVPNLTLSMEMGSECSFHTFLVIFEADLTCNGISVGCLNIQSQSQIKISLYNMMS